MLLSRVILNHLAAAMWVAAVVDEPGAVPLDCGINDVVVIEFEHFGGVKIFRGKNVCPLTVVSRIKIYYGLPKGMAACFLCLYSTQLNRGNLVSIKGYVLYITIQLMRSADGAVLRVSFDCEPLPDTLQNIGFHRVDGRVNRKLKLVVASMASGHVNVSQ